MSIWLVKTFIQHLIGFLPKSHTWNIIFQKYITNGYYPKKNVFDGKLACCQKHLDHYLEFSGGQHSGFNALELGTGSWPVVPIGLYLCGAESIWTYDIAPLLRRDILKKTLCLFHQAEHTGSLRKILNKARPDRIEKLKRLMQDVEGITPINLLQKLNIHICVGDARETKLHDNSIDFIFSTVVLEHISSDVLVGLLDTFKRVAKSQAIMSHHIGLCDQYASFDKSITPFNFLKYSDRQWRFLNNSVIPLNRLRPADYRNIFQQTKWNIVKETNVSGELSELKQIKLATKFQHHSTEDLLVLYSWIVAQPINK